MESEAGVELATGTLEEGKVTDTAEVCMVYDAFDCYISLLKQMVSGPMTLFNGNYKILMGLLSIQVARLKAQRLRR